MPVQFRTRTRGTARQVGQRFPVIEKKKLPPRISIKRPTYGNRDSGISDITYMPPNEDKEGYIEFKFDGHKISGAIRLVDKEDSIGQWSTSGRPIVFLDKKIGIGWIKYLSLHELLERFLQNRYNIPWQPYGHLISDEIERREFLKSHPKSEWEQYSKQVKQVSRMNQGGKLGSKRANLERAFEVLAEKRRQLTWAERGLDGIVQK